MPFIAYDNVLETATVTASSEQLQFPFQNAFDGLIYPADVWKPAGSGASYLYIDAGAEVTPDYFAFANYYADQITLSRCDASYLNPVTVVSFTGLSNSSGVKYANIGFPSSSRYWIIMLNKFGEIPLLGHVSFGQRMERPESVQIGFSPANLSRSNEYLNSVSDGGFMLGRSLVREGSEMNLSFDLLSPTWVRNSWLPFSLHAEQKPFFFAWDYDNHNDETALCWTDKKQAAPVYSFPNLMKVALRVKAFL